MLRLHPLVSCKSCQVFYAETVTHLSQSSTARLECNLVVYFDLTVVGLGTQRELSREGAEESIAAIAINLRDEAWNET